MTDELNKSNIIVNVKKTGEKKRKISKPVIFGLLLLILFYLSLLIASNIYLDIKSGGDENGYFHEILAVFFIICIGFIGYVKIFKKKFFIKNNKKKLIKSSLEIKEKELKERFYNARKLLKESSQTIGKIDGIHKLIHIALEDTERRQAVINYLDGVNQWMGESRALLLKENLITWRLRGNLFNFVEEDKQRLSLETLIGIEKIIKKHSEEFKNKETDMMLDLSSKYIPALNLGFIQLLPGSIIFDFAFLWQTSFWQGQILDISFVSTELQGANFWRCYLEQNDFGGANLRNAKLKTNLKEIRNLSPAQFFSTQEWALNILNEQQIKRFFPDQSPKNKAWEEWTSNEEARILLESTINKPE